MHYVELVEQFLGYIDSERNFSSHTGRSYGADLTQFCGFLAGGISTQSKSAGETGRGEGLANLPPLETVPAAQLQERLLAVTPTDIRAFLAAMRNANYSKSTIAR